MAPHDTRLVQKKRPVTVQLSGQSFTLVSDNDETRVAEIVSFLDERLNALRAQAPRLTAEQAALLVALNIAEDLFDARDQAATLREAVRQRSRRLLSAIGRLADEDREALAPRSGARGDA